MRIVSVVSVVVACVLSTGCAFTPQTANIAPTLSVTPSSQGAGTTVAVRVVDERPSKSLGRRGSGYGPAAEITAAEDLALVVRDEIIAGLQQKGFNTTFADAAATPKLTVEIRLLEYSTSTGFWTGGVHINGAVKAIAHHGQQTYEKMYRSEEEQRVVFVPGDKENEKWINQALSEVLNQMFEDQALIQFLAAGT